MDGGPGDPIPPPVPEDGVRRRTFAQAVLSTAAKPASHFPVKAPRFTDQGEPAVFFSKGEIQASLEPLKYAVIAKCSYGRPAFMEIKSCLSQRMNLSSDFVISRLNQRHLLFRFECKEDFLRILIQKHLYIKGFLFRFFRWSSDFDYKADPASAPVWLGFPELPANLYHEDCIRSIAGNFGMVLRIHDNTLAMTDTSEALVCVELDLAAPRKERIWIDTDGEGFWQPVNFHRVPHLCSICHKLGHTAQDCKKQKNKTELLSNSNVVPPAKQLQVYKKVGCSKDVRQNANLSNSFAALSDEGNQNAPAEGSGLRLDTSEKPEMPEGDNPECLANPSSSYSPCSTELSSEQNVQSTNKQNFIKQCSVFSTSLPDSNNADEAANCNAQNTSDYGIPNNGDLHDNLQCLDTGGPIRNSDLLLIQRQFSNHNNPIGDLSVAEQSMTDNILMLDNLPRKDKGLDGCEEESFHGQKLCKPKIPITRAKAKSLAGDIPNPAHSQ